MGQAKVKKLNAEIDKAFVFLKLEPPADSEFEAPVPTPEAVVAAAKALKEIRSRSFSGRNPDLGKMIKCHVCGLRHRDSIKCEQKFVELFTEEDVNTGEKTVVYAVAVQQKGIEVPGQRLDELRHAPTLKQLVGAAAFKGKRKKKRQNKRTLQFIELVRKLVPDEYTEKELNKARKKAARLLAKKFGRFGFFPRKSAPQPKKEEADAA